MDELKKCALSFQNLLRTDFIIKAGKKGKLVEFIIFFNEEHFHHLIGLHKLTDMTDISKAKNKKKIFKDIVSGDFCCNKIKDSYYFHEVKERLKYFCNINDLLNNDIIIRFDNRKAHSSIRATVMLYNKKENIYHCLFFNPFKHDNNKLLVPCSFFSTKSNKYIQRQEIYKVLDIEKRSHKY